MTGRLFSHLVLALALLALVPQQAELQAAAAASPCASLYTTRSADSSTCALAWALGLNDTTLLALNPTLDPSVPLAANVTLCLDIPAPQPPVPGGGGGGGGGGSPIDPDQPMPGPQVNPCLSTYTIKAGDTCAKVWKAAGLDGAAFTDLNPYINCGFLMPGDQVCLSDGVDRHPPVAPVMVCVNYTSVEGETCASIAAGKSITSDTFNNLNPNLTAACASGAALPAGTYVCAGVVDASLLPPSGLVCNATVLVRAGDTCSKIAQAHNVTLKELQAMNLDLLCNALQIGASVCVMFGPPQPPSPPSPPSPPPPPMMCTKHHTVVSGEYCDQIRLDAGLDSVSELEAMNPGLDCASLQVGQTLCVSQEVCTRTHAVARDETCDAIRSANHISLEQLLAMNPGVDCNSLQIGQVLCVSQSVCNEEHTVAPGDTCYDICKAYEISQDQLDSFNPGLDCATLQIGQTLCVDQQASTSGARRRHLQQEQSSSRMATETADAAAAPAPGQHPYRNARLQAAQLSAASSKSTARTRRLSAASTASSASASSKQRGSRRLLSAAPACARTHVVARGEHCHFVASRNSLTLRQLSELNPRVRCDHLRPGQELCVRSGHKHEGARNRRSLAELHRPWAREAPAFEHAESYLPQTASFSSRQGDVNVDGDGDDAEPQCSHHYVTKEHDHCFGIKAVFGLRAGELEFLNPGVRCPAPAPGTRLCIRAADQHQDHVRLAASTKQRVLLGASGDDAGEDAPLSCPRASVFVNKALLPAISTCIDLAASFAMPLARFHELNPHLGCGHRKAVIDRSGLARGACVDPLHCPEGSVLHRVEPGDTCSGLAFRTGPKPVPLSAFEAVNPALNCSTTLIPGWPACVPPPLPQDKDAVVALFAALAEHVKAQDPAAWRAFLEYLSEDESAAAVTSRDGPARRAEVELINRLMAFVATPSGHDALVRLFEQDPDFAAFEAGKASEVREKQCAMLQAAAAMPGGSELRDCMCAPHTSYFFCAAKVHLAFERLHAQHAAASGRDFGSAGGSGSVTWRESGSKFERAPRVVRTTASAGGPSRFGGAAADVPLRPASSIPSLASRSETKGFTARGASSSASATRGRNAAVEALLRKAKASSLSSSAAISDEDLAALALYASNATMLAAAGSAEELSHGGRELEWGVGCSFGFLKKDGKLDVGSTIGNVVNECLKLSCCIPMVPAVDFCLAAGVCVPSIDFVKDYIMECSSPRGCPRGQEMTEESLMIVLDTEVTVLEISICMDLGPLTWLLEIFGWNPCLEIADIIYQPAKKAWNIKTTVSWIVLPIEVTFDTHIQGGDPFDAFCRMEKFSCEEWCKLKGGEAGFRIYFTATFLFWSKDWSIVDTHDDKPCYPVAPTASLESFAAESKAAAQQLPAAGAVAGVAGDASGSSNVTVPQQPRVVAYYPNWYIYSHGNKPPLAKDQLSKITHINYAFLTVSYHPATDGYYVDYADPWADVGVCVSDDPDKCDTGLTCLDVPVNCDNGVISHVPSIMAQGANAYCNDKPGQGCYNPGGPPAPDNRKTPCYTSLTEGYVRPFWSPPGQRPRHRNACGQFGHLLKEIGLSEEGKHIRMMLSLGGWYDSTFWSQAMATAGARAKLIRSIVDFVRTYGFDGVDLDIEFPGFEHAGQPPYGKKSDGGSPDTVRDCATTACEVDRSRDGPNMVLFLSELKTEFSRFASWRNEPYLVSLATGAGNNQLSKYDLKGVCENVDFLNIMAYDLHGAWDSITNHQAPLFANTPGFRPASPGAREYSVDDAVGMFLAAGCDPQKLTMGLPFYGRAFKGVGGDVPAPPDGNATANGTAPSPHALTCGEQPYPFPDLPGLYMPHQGSLPASESIIQYRDIATTYPNMTTYYDQASGASFGYDAATRTFISFDDERAIADKMAYARGKGLGGAMFWMLGGDDDKSTLLDAVNAGLAA